MNLTKTSAVIILLLAASLSSAQAASGTWGANSSGDWSDTTKWAGGTVADGAGNAASFIADFTADCAVTLDSGRTVGLLKFNDSGAVPDINSLTLTGPGVLTLDRGTVMPDISVADTNQLVLDVVVTGTNGFTLGSDTGTFTAGVNSWLVFNKPATYSGETQLQRGNILIGTDNALPASTVITFLVNNTKRVYLNGHTLTVAGLVAVPGSSGTKQLLDNSTGNPGTIIINVASNQYYDVGCSLGTAGNANYGVVKTGPGTQRFSKSGGNLYDGVTVIQDGILDVAQSANLGSATAGTFITNTGTLGLSANDTSGEALTVSGSGFNGMGAIAVLSGSRTLASPITLTGHARIGVDFALTLTGTVSGTGNLTFIGTNTLTFSGFQSHAGITVISNAALAVPSTLTFSGGGVAIAEGVGVSLSPLAQLQTPSLVLGNGGQVNLGFAYGDVAGSNPTTPAITDPASSSGTLLTASATNIVVSISGSGFVTGQFPLVKYSGALGGNGFGVFTLGTLPPGVLGRLVNNTANGSIDLVITLVVNALTWYGNISANWDINTSANWKDSSLAAATYKEYGTTNIVGDVVTFDDTVFSDGLNPPKTNINLTTILRPAAVNISGFSTPYTFAGTGGGKLSGSGIVNVNGTSSLTMNVANDYAGGTTLSSGSLLLGNDWGLGIGPVNLAGGTLGTAGGARTVSNAVQLTATSTMNVAEGDLTLTGPLSSTGNFDLFVQGGKQLIVKGTIANVGAGGADIQASRMVIDGAGCTNADDGIRLYAQGSVAELEIKNGGTYELGLLSGSPNLRLGQVAGEAGTNILRITSGLLLMRDRAQAIIVGDKSGTTGIVYQAGGTVAFRSQRTEAGIAFGSQTNAYGEYHLGGGILDTPRVYLSAGALGGFYFNGGTLRATTNLTTNPFFSGVSGIIQAGGAVVDSAGLDLLMTSDLGGAGDFTKNGPGTLTLTGTNTYAGNTFVNEGGLILGPAHNAVGNVAVADGAMLGCWSDAAGVSLEFSSASLGSATGATLLAQFTGRFGNPTAPVAFVTNLTLNGVVPVSVTLGGIQVGRIPIVRYTTLAGTGTVATGNLPQGVVGTVTNNPATKTIELVVNHVTPLVWTATSSTVWDVGASTNWALSSAATTYQDGDNVRFDDSAANPGVVIAQPVSPGSVLFHNTGVAYSIATAGPGKLSGNTGITKDGTNRVNLGGVNDFTGDVIIKNGILELANAGALGATSGATCVSNGATLNMKDIRLTSTLEPIYITGEGYAGLGALYSDTGNGNADFLRDLRLSGDAWVGAAAGARFGFSDVAGTVTCVGGLHKFTKVGGGQFDFEEATVTVGDIEVKEGVLQSANATTINAGYGITVQSGAEFRIYRIAVPLARPFILNNGLINVSGWNGAGQNQLEGDITLNSAGTFQVGSGFEATLTKGVKGSGALTKTGAGLLTMSAANTYTGGTMVSGGTLALAAGASIAASPLLRVDMGATLDVSGVAPWVLGAGQTLSGSGTLSGNVTAHGTVSPGTSVGTLTFANDLALSGTTVMEVSKDGGLTNDVISVGGVLSCGGTLRVAVMGSTPLAVGDVFDLFNWAGGVAGAFASTQLPAEYSWDVSQLAVDGSIRVTGVNARPTLNWTQAGNSLQITWSGSGYKLQAQTNALDVGLSNNWGDYPGGTSSPIIVPIDPAAGTVFFRLSLP